MLLGFPANHLARIGLLHAVHRDLLHDHITATDRDDHLLRLHAGRPHALLDRFSHDPGVHDFAFDDGVVADRGERDLGQNRTTGRVRNRDELDKAAPDVEADRRRLASEESHTCPRVKEASGNLGGQRATDVPHKLQFGNRLRDDHLTGEKSLRCSSLSAEHLLFRKLSLGMQQWRQSVEQHCKFWQLVQLEPRPLPDRQQNLRPGGGIGRQAHQQSRRGRSQLSASPIDPGGPALDQEEIIGQSAHLPLQPEPRVGHAWSEIQGRACDWKHEQTRSRDLRHSLPQLALGEL